jgi:hypothetical protein
MKAPVKTNNISFDPAPAGMQRAVVIGLYNFGTQKYKYMGEEKTRHEVRVVFELSDSLKVFKEGEPEKPYVIAKSGSYSMNSKAFLRSVVEACAGCSLSDSEAEAYEIESILGKACLLNVGHYTDGEGNTKAKIISVAPLVRGMSAPEQKYNQPILFDIDKYTDDEYDDLSDWMKEKVNFAKQMRENKKSGITAKEALVMTDEDIPF